MSFARLWAFLAVGLPVLGGVVASLPSVDLAYHLRVGGQILDAAAIPRTDTMTFTAMGAPWQDQQWAAQVILAVAYRLGGWTGLVVLRAMLVGVAFGLLFDLCRRRSGSTRVAAWLTLAAFASAAISLALRPQLIGVAIFAAVLWLVLRRAEIGRAVWLIVPLVAIWGNVHGSFILAPVMLGIALVEDLLDRSRDRTRGWRSSATVLAVTVLATFVNPFGIGVWGYAAGISTNSTIGSRITEWQPTTIRSPEGVVFFASTGLVAIAFAAAAARGRRPRATALLWLMPFLVIGLWAVRGLAWWPFVAAATVAPLTAAASGASATRVPDAPLVRRLNAAIAGAIVLIAVLALPVWRPFDRGLGAPAGVVGTAPSGITSALRAETRPGDRILAPQPWGSWLEFAIPAATVAVDSRIELIPQVAWDSVDRIESGGPGWQQTLADWQVSFVVAPAADTGLVGRLTGAGWQTVFSDEDGTVLRPPATGDADG